MPDDLEKHRKRMTLIAYRMLGSAAEADDVVQDAMLRAQGATDIHTPEAWLTTTVTRLCLDRLKSARMKREIYVGPWLPEPVAASKEELDVESLSVAFLLLLERLGPIERAAFVLHRVFDFSHAEIAEMLERSEASVRQSLHRATEHMHAERARFAPDKARHVQLLGSFVMACQSGDVNAIKSVLVDDARAWTDGGGKVRAARRVIVGSDRIARLFHGLNKKFPVTGVPELRELNGQPSIIVWRDGKAQMVVGIETDGSRIHAVHVVLNPDKLAHLQAS